MAASRLFQGQQVANIQKMVVRFGIFTILPVFGLALRSDKNIFGNAAMNTPHISHLTHVTKACQRTIVLIVEYPSRGAISLWVQVIFAASHHGGLGFWCDDCSRLTKHRANLKCCLLRYLAADHVYRLACAESPHDTHHAPLFACVLPRTSHVYRYCVSTILLVRPMAPLEELSRHSPKVRWQISQRKLDDPRRTRDRASTSLSVRHYQNIRYCKSTADVEFLTSRLTFPYSSLYPRSCSLQSESQPRSMCPDAMQTYVAFTAVKAVRSLSILLQTSILTCSFYLRPILLFTRSDVLIDTWISRELGYQNSPGNVSPIHDLLKCNP
ncbi:hypothetical protein IMY05_C4485000600 [Salix suchowensis]|nr:hypothetical protein IMY05_C4485000600 [Salix suchowensis]